jgi:hypothetical protein
MNIEWRHRLDLPADHPSKGNNDDTRNNAWLADFDIPHHYLVSAGQREGSTQVWVAVYERIAGRLMKPVMHSLPTESAALEFTGRLAAAAKLAANRYDLSTLSAEERTALTK